MLYDLLKYNFQRVDLRTIPRTGALLDQITKTISSAQRFWHEILRRGYIVEAGEWPNFIKVQELYEQYIEFAKNINVRHRAAVSEFGKELRKVCADVRRKQIALDGKRQYVFYLPDLDNCRKLFEKNTGIKEKWGDD